jgi:Cellulose biosynthesis protein BcsS
MDKTKHLGDSRNGGARTARRIAAFLLAFASAAASAEGLFLLGGETSKDSGYAYSAVLLPFPGSTLGNGFVHRYWVEWLRYEYLGGPLNQVIEAKAPGAEFALGYQKANPTGYFGVYAGALYRDTELTPDDPSSKARGEHVRLRLQVEGEHRFQDTWVVNGIASYAFGQDGYWLRGRVLRRVSGHILAGIEGVTQGDPDYEGWAVGAVLTGFEPAPRWNLGFKAGVKKIEGRSSNGYIGIEIAKSFGK